MFALFLFSGYFKTALGPLQSKIDLTLLLLALSFMIAVKRLYQRPVVDQRYAVSWFLFILLACMASFSLSYSSSYAYGLDKSLRFMIITGWSFFGVFLLIRTKESAQRFFHGVVIVSTALAGFALMELNSRLGVNYMGTIAAVGSDYLSLGRTAGIGVLLLITFCLYNEKLTFKSKSLFFVLLLFVLTALIVSGSRMPLIATGFCIIFILFYSFRLKGKKIMVNSGFAYISAFSVVAIFAGLYAYAHGFFDTIIHRMTMLIERPDGGNSAAARMERFDAAIQMFNAKSFLGNGIGSFAVEFSGRDTRSYPHNIFLEFMSELGIVGVMAFIMLIALALFYGVVVYKKANHYFDSLQLTIVIGFVFMLLNANVSGDINDNRMLFTFISLLLVSPFLQHTLKAGGGIRA